MATWLVDGWYYVGTGNNAENDRYDPRMGGNGVLPWEFGGDGEPYDIDHTLRVRVGNVRAGCPAGRPTTLWRLDDTGLSTAPGTHHDAKLRPRPCAAATPRVGGGPPDDRAPVPSRPVRSTRSSGWTAADGTE